MEQLVVDHDAKWCNIPAILPSFHVAQPDPAALITPQASAVDMSSTAANSVDAGEGLQIVFDNNSDAECTVVTVEGQDKAHLLVSLTGAFSAASVTVVSASITSDEGRVLDVFRVQTADGKKVRCLPGAWGLGGALVVLRRARYLGFPSALIAPMRWHRRNAQHNCMSSSKGQP